MSKIELGLTRMSREAERVFDKFVAAKEIAAALKILATLAGKSVEEVQEVTGYDRKSGRPNKFKWAPVAWDGRLYGWLDATPIRAKILNALPVGGLSLVETKGQHVVIEHVGAQYETGGTSPAHLRIRVAQPL